MVKAEGTSAPSLTVIWMMDRKGLELPILIKICALLILMMMMMFRAQ